MARASYAVAVDWDYDGDWYESGHAITEYVKRMSWANGAQNPLQRASDVGEAVLELINADKRFSPDYASGALYPNVKPSRPIRIRAGRFTDNDDLADSVYLLEGLVCWHRLEEASGTRYDVFGNHNFAEHGAPVGYTGKQGTAAYFDNATPDYLDVASDAELQPGDRDFTFVAWVKADGLIATMRAASKWNTVGNQRQWNIGFDNPTERFLFQVSSAGTAATVTQVFANTFGAVTSGVWYMLAGVHDAVNNLIKISVNGGAFDTAAHSTGVFATGTAKYTLAANEGGTSPWEGWIDEAAFYKRALSQAELLAMYNSGSGRTLTNAGQFFTGTIAEIIPAPGTSRERLATLRCLDDVVRLQRNDVALPIQQNKRSDELISAVVADCYTPPSTDYGTGDDTYPYAGDQWFTRSDAPTDIARYANRDEGYSLEGNGLKTVEQIARSEYGRFWISGDGVPTFRSRSYFQETLGTAAHLNDDFMALSPSYPIEAVANDVTVSYYPRTLGTATDEVLWTLTAQEFLGPREAKTFRAQFTGANNRSVRVGAVSIMTPVANTDYVFKQTTGDDQTPHTGEADLTGQLTFGTVNNYGSYAIFTVTNNGGNTGVFTTLQLRGQKLTVNETRPAQAASAASQAEYGNWRLEFDVPLQNNGLKAKALADYFLYDMKDAQALLGGAMIGNDGTAQLANILSLATGDQITLSEAQLGISARRYWIIGSKHEVTDGMKVHRLSLSLERSHASEFLLLGDATYGKLGTGKLGY